MKTTLDQLPKLWQITGAEFEDIKAEKAQFTAKAKAIREHGQKKIEEAAKMFRLNVFNVVGLDPSLTEEAVTLHLSDDYADDGLIIVKVFPAKEEATE